MQYHPETGKKLKEEQFSFDPLKKSPHILQEFAAQGQMYKMQTKKKDSAGIQKQEPKISHAEVRFGLDRGGKITTFIGQTELCL